MRHGAARKGHYEKRREHQVRQWLEVQQAKAQQQELQQKIQIPHTQARPAGNRGRWNDQPLRRIHGVSPDPVERRRIAVLFR